MTQILFCADQFMAKRELVEKFIQQSFPAPQFYVISLAVHPDRVAEQVDKFFREHQLNSNPPALFFYWSSQSERADIASIWRPLFEKCRAVALIDFVTSVDQAKDIERYWKNAWKHDQMYRVVTLNAQQQSLTSPQYNALQEVCNVEVKKSLDKSRYYIFGLVALAALALIGLLFQRHNLKFHFDKPA
jgi:hypothetical protein